MGCGFFKEGPVTSGIRFPDAFFRLLVQLPRTDMHLERACGRFGDVRGGYPAKGGKLKSEGCHDEARPFQGHGNRRNRIFWCIFGYDCSLQVEEMHIVVEHVRTGCVYVRRRGAELKVGGRKW